MELWKDRCGGGIRGGGERMRYLVAKALRGNDGNLIADALVGFEVEGEFWVVALDDDLGGFLDRLWVRQ